MNFERRGNTSHKVWAVNWNQSLDMDHIIQRSLNEMHLYFADI